MLTQNCFNTIRLFACEYIIKMQNLRGFIVQTSKKLQDFKITLAKSLGIL